MAGSSALFFFFFNDTATTEIYTLSLHDALPISHRARPVSGRALGLCVRGQSERGAVRRTGVRAGRRGQHRLGRDLGDRKSTRLNSSHLVISYAVFCLKKKKKYNKH